MGVGVDGDFGERSLPQECEEKESRSLARFGGCCGFDGRIAVAGDGEGGYCFGISGWIGFEEDIAVFGFEVFGG